MDDVYAINLAKSQLRDAFNAENIARVMSIYTPRLSNMMDGCASFWGEDGFRALAQSYEELWKRFRVTLTPVVIDVVVHGAVANVIGWHKLQLHPRHGGPASDIKERYFEEWAKNEKGDWKICMLITNREHPKRLLPEAGDPVPLVYAGLGV